MPTTSGATIGYSETAASGLNSPLASLLISTAKYSVLGLLKYPPFAREKAHSPRLMIGSPALLLITPRNAPVTELKALISLTAKPKLLSNSSPPILPKLPGANAKSHRNASSLLAMSLWIGLQMLSKIAAATDRSRAEICAARPRGS